MCLLQVLMAVFTAWAISAILTAAGVFPPQTEFWTTHTAGEVNGTTVEIDMIADAPWFYIPYPGNTSMPHNCKHSSNYTLFEAAYESPQLRMEINKACR